MCVRVLVGSRFQLIPDQSFGHRAITHDTFDPMNKGRLSLFLLVSLLGGCSSLGYYSQVINGHLDLMARREPLQQLVDDPGTTAGLRQRLRLVLAIREFASAQLFLPDNGSYRSFAQVEGLAVVWSLVATEEFSLQPLEWCYPVIGCASYRGYYSRQEGERQEGLIKTQGMDTTLEPVPAYSTLGWFDDPLPSTVVDWSETRLARLIFHELAHQKIYLPGDSAFNEALANTVAWWGVKRWLESEADEAALENWRRQQRRERSFIALLLKTRRHLSEIYLQPITEEQKRQRKQEAFQRMKKEYVAMQQQWQGYRGYDDWFSRELNNARLASVATYEQWAPAFRVLLRQSKNDMEVFYRACEELGQQPSDERRRRMEALLSLYHSS